MAETESRDSPLVSIVLPVKNGAEFISRAIRSVLDQTYHNWELLVVDDHSEDETAQIVKAYGKREERICLIALEGERTGVAYARRRGIDAAAGDWIAFLDSDDIWLPDKLQVQMEQIKASGCPFVFSASMFIDTNDRQKRFVFRPPAFTFYPEILKQDVISCSSVLIRKDLLADCFHERSNGISDDYAAWIRVLRDRVGKAVCVDEPLVRYRISQRSLSSNKLASARRTYRTYRHVGLSVSKALYYWCFYVARSLKKYSGIYFR